MLHTKQILTRVRGPVWYSCTIGNITSSVWRGVRQPLLTGSVWPFEHFSTLDQDSCPSADRQSINVACYDRIRLIMRSVNPVGRCSTILLSLMPDQDAS